MSIQRFQTILKTFLDSPVGTKDSSQFINTLTNEYDILMRFGFQTTNPQIRVVRGNTELMKTLLKQQLASNLISTKPIKLVERLGVGMRGYWQGAQLTVGIPPIIPAPGGISNITTNSVLVTNTGVFKFPSKQLPVSGAGSFISQLVLGIRQHIRTISGLYFTTTLYPAVPTPFAAPGVVPWSGYSVSGVTTSGITSVDIDEFIDEIRENLENERSGTVVPSYGGGGNDGSTDEGGDKRPTPQPPSGGTQVLVMFSDSTMRNSGTSTGALDININGTWYNYSTSFSPDVSLNVVGKGVVINTSTPIRSFALRPSQLRKNGLNNDCFGFATIKTQQKNSRFNPYNVTTNRGSINFWAKSFNGGQLRTRDSKNYLIDTEHPDYRQSDPFYAQTLPSSWSNSGKFMIWVDGVGQNHKGYTVNNNRLLSPRRPGLYPTGRTQALSSCS